MPALNDAPMKPLIFCNRSILAWQQHAKTQTRRLVNPQPDKDAWFLKQLRDGRWVYADQADRARIFWACKVRQPHVPNDLLWIREALRTFHEPAGPRNLSLVLYDADGVLVHPVDPNEVLHEWPWKRDKLPAMFMPRWACRHYAKVVNVRPERLRGITVGDAAAEGVLVADGVLVGGSYLPMTIWYPGRTSDLYLEWWDELHKKAGTRSEDNPWVWKYVLEPSHA